MRLFVGLIISQNYMCTFQINKLPKNKSTLIYFAFFFFLQELYPNQPANTIKKGIK